MQCTFLCLSDDPRHPHSPAHRRLRAASALCRFFTFLATLLLRFSRFSSLTTCLCA